MAALTLAGFALTEVVEVTRKPDFERAAVGAVDVPLGQQMCSHPLPQVRIRCPRSRVVRFGFGFDRQNLESTGTSPGGN
jgi:hypothetical protein